MSRPLQQRSRVLRGFTLIELVVTVALVGVMAAIAAPSFSELMAATRMKGDASNLHVTLLKARAEAIKRNASVYVMPSGGDWAAGWSVRWDPVDDPDVLDADDEELASESRATSVVSITPDPSDLSRVIYLPSGRANCPECSGSESPSFEFAATDKTDKVRCVTVQLSGMPAVRTTPC